MQQIDKLAVLDDIEIEYKKLYNECKKKHEEVKEGIDKGLNIWSKWKTLHIGQWDIELKQTVDPWLSPIILASQQKIRKLYVSSLAVIKKWLSYGLIKQKHSNSIIIILKDILSNSTEEFVQIKVIETLLPMVDPLIIQLSEKLVMNVMDMCLKFFSLKSAVFKNPLNVWLKQLIRTVFEFFNNSWSPIINKMSKNPEMFKEMMKLNKETEDAVKPQLLNSQKMDEGKDDTLDLGIENNENNTIKEEDPRIESNEEEKNNEIGEDDEKEEEEVSSSNNTNTNPQEVQKENEMKQENKNNNNNNTTTTQTNAIPYTPAIDLSEYEDTEIFKCAQYLFNRICDLCEGTKNPIIYITVYSKCLGYELLASVLSVTKNLFTYLPTFLDRIKSTLSETLMKTITSANDYVTCTKLCRLIITININLLIYFDFIPYIIKYVESTAINWQKQIGIESFCLIFSSNALIENWFNTAKETYSNLITALTKVSYALVLNKNSFTDLEGNTLYKVNQNYLLLHENIFSETDATAPTVTNSTIYLLTIQAYINYQKSFSHITEIVYNPQEKKEEESEEFLSKQSRIKEMIEFKQDSIIPALIAIIQCTVKEDWITKLMELFIDSIRVYGLWGAINIRNMYLLEINKIITNDSNNSWTSPLCEKVMKTVFEIFKNINVLDRSGFVSWWDSLQKIYWKVLNSDYNFMIKPNQDFELEVYVKYFEGNIKKYTNIEIEDIIKPEAPDQSQSGNMNINSENVLNQANLNYNGNNENTSDEGDHGQDSGNKVTEKVASTVGLFSRWKYAWGFSKQSVKEAPSEHWSDKERIWMKELSEKLESLFLVESINYSDDTIIDWVTAWNDSSKTLCEVAVPTLNQAYCLHFNWLKFHELSIVNYKRLHLIWEIFISTTSTIACKQIKSVSYFSVDILSISSMLLLSLFKNISVSEYEASYSLSKIESYSFINYQRKIINSWTKLAEKNISQDMNLNILYDWSMIIRNSVKEWNTEGWNEIFNVFSKQISAYDEAQTENSFMLWEEIINKNFNLMTPGNIIPWADWIEGFIRYKKNENIAVSSLQIFNKWSDLIEKFGKYIYVNSYNKEAGDKGEGLNENQINFFTYYCKNKSDEKRKLFDVIWKGMFNKIINITCDERPHIRKLCIDTFKEIYFSKSKLISPEVALIIWNANFISVFEKTNEIYEEKLKYSRKLMELRHQTNKGISPKSYMNQGDGTKTITGGTTTPFRFGDFFVDQMKLPEKKVNKYDESKIPKPTEEELFWEATLQETIKGATNAITTFWDTNPNLGYEYYVNNIYTVIIEKYSQVMKYTSPKIFLSLLDSVYNVGVACPDCFYKNYQRFWPIYEEMARFISTEYFLSTFPKMAIECDMVRNIWKHLKQIYWSKDNIKLNPDLIQGVNIDHLIYILTSLIKSSENSEGNSLVDAPFKLLNEEILIFDYCLDIQKVLFSYTHTSNNDSLSKYLNYLSKYLTIDLRELHSEALCRKSLEMFSKFFTDHWTPNEIVFQHLPVFINNSRAIICWRNNSEYVSALLRPSKTETQIWNYCSRIWIKILTFIISKYNNQIKLSIQNQTDSTMININPIWECLINCYENIFRQSESGFKSISRNIYEDFVQSCQEMEIAIINFIVNTLLPNSLYIPKEMQIKILTLLDMGSNFDYNTPTTSTSTSALASNISKVCISNLFELCKYKANERWSREVPEGFNVNDYISIKIKIAKMCTPILIKRCKETLRKFLDDEVKSGSMPLSRSRLEDIKFVLEKLKDWEIYPNYNNLEIKENEINKQTEKKEMMDFILMKKKSHLISLLPLLSEFITTKENEIKIIVKEIFRIISEELGIKY